VKFRTLAASWLAATAAAALALPAGGTPETGQPANQVDKPRLSAPELTDGPTLDPQAAGVTAERLVAVPAGALNQEAVASALAQALPGADVTVELTDGPTGAVTIEAGPSADPAAVAEALTETGMFEAVEYDFTPVPLYSAAPDDPAFAESAQWALEGFPGAGFDGVWAALAAANPANSIPIAVIDTGFDFSHRDHCANIIGKYDYGDNDADVSPASAVTKQYHGTATAGLIGACTNNGLDVAGAAWDQAVYVYKITSGSAGTMTSAALINAIRGAANDGARVISLSLGVAAAGMPSTLRSAVDYAIGKGALVVAASGNYGVSQVNGQTNPLVFPAAYGPVVSVGATGLTAEPADFSSFNQYVDLAAPGVDITVLGPANTIAVENGTSFAAPLVAAAAGMLLRFNPELTQSQLASLLVSSAHDVSTTGWDAKTGAGVLDVVGLFNQGRAYDHTLPEPPPAHMLTQLQILLSPDMDNDGHGEVIAVSTDGQLTSHTASRNGVLGVQRVLGSSFDSVTIYASGDWNGDGKADLMARDGNGYLLLYPGDGIGYVNYSGVIGNGWSAYRVIPCGDLTGDNIIDLLAINSAGDLILYAGAGNSKFKYPYPKVGNGWTDFELYAAGDLNADGRNDILGIDAKGDLYAYYGLGDGRFATKIKAGNGWTGFTLAAGADLSGDGLADLVSRDAAGHLYFYRGLGKGTFATKVAIGTGW
jgi:subtilisin family serine protease